MANNHGVTVSLALLTLIIIKNNFRNLQLTVSVMLQWINHLLHQFKTKVQHLKLQSIQLNQHSFIVQ